MTPAERTEHQNKMHEGLASILRLLPLSTEVGAVSLLDMGLRALCVMRDDGDLAEAEAQGMRAALVAAFQAAHPRLDTALSGDLSILNEVIAKVLSAPQTDAELVQLAKGALREFRDRGLRTIH
jgi:hypothetical protein